MLKLCISVMYYLNNIFTNVNDHITHICMSFLIGHVEENLFGSPPVLQFSLSTIYYQAINKHSFGKDMGKVASCL